MYHNLDKSFNRVNQIYFNGTMDKPHLVWNNQKTYRKYGHFQKDINTVMVSISLDQPRIPSYVVDYVMYHELLHKHLGARKVNNRRYTHTKEFKTKERRFSQAEQAQQYLSKLAQNRS